MKIEGDSHKCPLRLLVLVLLSLVGLKSASATCELSLIHHKTLYNYSLANPVPKYPHGILSEDGFYKVAINQTVLWFQLCDAMIFNHNPPKCVGCSGCGGPSRCGMNCSALVASNIDDYPVCTTLGHASSTIINAIDQKNPHMGVILKMLSIGPKFNCSLSVSVICDSKGVQEPQALEIVGTCDYVTQLRHPSGCANIVSVHGKGWGLFGTFITLFLCLFGAYVLVGTVYRFFFLGVRGIDVFPNLDFWASIPQRAQSSVMSLVRKFRGPSQGYRNSYSPVNF